MYQLFKAYILKESNARFLGLIMYYIHSQRWWPTLKIHLSVSVSVQDINDSPNERVLLQLRDAEKLVHRQRPILVQVQLVEAVA